MIRKREYAAVCANYVTGESHRWTCTSRSGLIARIRLRWWYWTIHGPRSWSPVSPGTYRVGRAERVDWIRVRASR